MIIFKSASKIVFLLIALTACIGFFIGLLPVESFMILATGAFTFYYAKPASSNDVVGGIDK